jgi:hypothetical protein
MKTTLLRILALSGLVSLTSSLWAAVPGCELYLTSQSINSEQATTFYGGVYSNFDYNISDLDYVVAYDVYVDGVLDTTLSTNGLYAEYEPIGGLILGNSLAPGDHLIEIYVYSSMGDVGYNSIGFQISE